MKKSLYIYSLASETELTELGDISKNWKDVSVISLYLEDTEKLKPDELQQLGKQLGERIVVELIKHNNKK